MSILPDSVAPAYGVTDTDAVQANAARQSGARPASSRSTIAAIVDPPAHCPGCLAEAGMPFPEGATTRHCPRCLDRIRRVYQCARWNQDHAHQVAAGHASWDAFSARWRASSGLAPLSVDAARRYVTPEMIRGPLGMFLPERLRLEIHRAWCVGQLFGVEAWLAEEGAPPHPDGLWASRAHAHDADLSPDAVTAEVKEVVDGGT